MCDDGRDAKRYSLTVFGLMLAEYALVGFGVFAVYYLMLVFRGMR